MLTGVVIPDSEALNVNKTRRSALHQISICLIRRPMLSTAFELGQPSLQFCHMPFPTNASLQKTVDFTKSLVFLWPYPPAFFVSLAI